MGRLLNRLGLRTWKRRLLAAAVAMVVLSVGSVELTSQSWFCNSCHIMGPYYESWRTGTHKDVACVKCHIAPGTKSFVAAKLNGAGQVVDDLLNRTSHKPSASVDQLSCTRSGCHDIERIRQTQKTDGIFKFRHDKHLDLEYRGIPLKCSSCHSHVKGDTHFEVNTDMCITCHFVERAADPAGEAALASAAPGGKPHIIRLAVRDGHAPAPMPAEGTHGAAGEKTAPFNCTACHEPPAGIIDRGGLKIDHAQYIAYGASCESCHRGVTTTPPPIEDGRCLACHTYGVERSLDAVAMHKVHSEGRHKIECFSCHGTVPHGPSSQTASIAQFDCRTCHAGQHEVQRSTYVTTAAPRSEAHGETPAGRLSPMFMAHVDCAGCHTKQRPLEANPTSGALVAIAVPQACDACHKPGLGEQMIPLWQKATRELYDALEADVNAAEALGRSPEAVGEARRILTLIRVDGSWGVHNPRYTQQLLAEARAALTGTPAPAEESR